MMRGAVFPSSAGRKGLWDGLTSKALERDFSEESKGPVSGFQVLRQRDPWLA